MKKQYRVQLLIVFIFLGGLVFLLFQPFLNGSVTGLSLSFVLPFKFLGENIPDFIYSIIPTDQIAVIELYLLPIINSGSFAGPFTFVLSALFAFNLLVMLLSALTVLFRLLFNLPYLRGKKLYLILFFVNIFFAALCLLTEKVEFVTKLFTDEGGVTQFAPEIWYYIFTGAWLLLYITTRIATKKLEI